MKKSNTYQSSFSHNDTMYEVWHSSRYDMAKEDNENINIDTVKAREIFAQSVIDFLNDNFATSFKYDGLYIPKFYNYEGDKIDFSYNDNDFDLLLSAINDYELSCELANNIQQVTTTCPGYVAYYNEDELKADNDLYIRVILETLFNSDYIQNEYEQYYDMQCIYDKLEDSVSVEDKQCY